MEVVPVELGLMGHPVRMGGPMLSGLEMAGAEGLVQMEAMEVTAAPEVRQVAAAVLAAAVLVKAERGVPIRLEPIMPVG